MTEDETRHPLVVKISLIGESGVGKTSIINRYIKNSYTDQQISTTGAVFSTRLITYVDEKMSLRLEIWDTAGQERYRSLAKVIYKNASIVVLVYDITNRESFDELKNFWIEEVKKNTKPNTLFGLAANKDDMYELEKVTIKEGTELAQKLDAVFQKTSAKSGSGVDQLFEKLGKKLINPDNEDYNKLSLDEFEEKYRMINAFLSGEVVQRQNKSQKGCC